MKKSVGQAVRDCELEREEIFISSKVLSGSQDPAASIRQSLKELDTEYIDLYFIHSPHGGKDTRMKIYKAMVDAKREGKIRDIGVSNFNVKHLEELREAGFEVPAVNQIELHPFFQQKPIVDYCKKHGILVSAYCPLVRAAFDNPVLQEVSKKNNKNPPQVLVRWSLQRGFIPLPKSSKPERVVSNADVYDFELSAEDMAKLDALDSPSGSISWNPTDVE